MPAIDVPDGGDWDANSAEELTFQFGETVEARERGIQARVEEDPTLEAEPVHIETVHRLLQLMEGRDAYLLLRQKAAEFARAYISGRTDASYLMDFESLGPGQRYALLRMTLDVLETRGHEVAAGQFRLEQTVAARDARSLTGDLFLEGRLDPARDAPAATDSMQTAEASGYYQTVSVAPTLRTLFDAVVNAAGMDRAADALKSIQAGWGKSISLRTAQDIGVFVGVTRLLTLVSTIVASASSFITSTGRTQTPPGLPFQCARNMLDLAVSSAPGSIADRLVGLVLAPASGAEAKIDQFATLFRLASGWPDPVWASTDTRVLVLQHLSRKRMRPDRDKSRSPRAWRLTRERLLRDWNGDKEQGQGHDEQH